MGIQHVPAAAVVHVGVNPVDILDDAGLAPGLELEIILSGMALVTHLGHHLGMAFGRLHQKPVLMEGAGQGFLAIDMDSFLDGAHGYREVGEVRRGYEHGLDILSHFVKHLAEILVALGLGEHSHYLCRVLCAHIHITKGDHVGKAGLGDLLGILVTPMADANKCDIDLFAGLPAHSRTLGRYSIDGVDGILHGKGYRSRSGSF